MNASLATFLCTMFVLSLFIIDKDSKKYFSYPLWIPFLWLLVISSRSVAYWFSDPGQAANDLSMEGSPINRNFYLTLETAGILVLLKRKVWKYKFFEKNLFVFILFIYCAISILWSDFLFTSFKRYLKTLSTLIMVLIVWTEPNPVESIKVLFKRCAYILIPTSILLYKYYGHIGRRYNPFDGGMMITGVTTHKNSLGYLCLVMGTFIIWNFSSKLIDEKIKIRKIDFIAQSVILVMVLWLLYLSHSATSQICLMLVTFLLLISTTDSFNKNYSRISLILILCILGFSIMEYLFNVKEILFNLVGRESNLTGRTDLWGLLLSMSENKFFGTGFNSFWAGHRIEKLWEIYWWQPKQAHNGFIEIYLNLGLVGVLLLILVLLSIYKKCLKNNNNEYDLNRFNLTILIAIIFYNFSESTFISINLLWFVLLVLSIRPGKLRDKKNNTNDEFMKNYKKLL
jgi:O-antigen ligase